jgi:hypothetical protein
VISGRSCTFLNSVILLQLGQQATQQAVSDHCRLLVQLDVLVHLWVLLFPGSQLTGG